MLISIASSGPLALSSTGASPAYPDPDAQLATALQRAEIEDANENLSVGTTSSSDGSEDDGSESEASTEDDVEKKVSNDEQEKDDKDKNEEQSPHDEGSSSAPLPSSLDDIHKKLETMSIDETKKTLGLQKARVIREVKMFKALSKKVQELKKKEKAEMLKTAKKDERERLVAVNVTGLEGTTQTLNVPLTLTGAMLRDRIAVEFGITTRKVIESFRLMLGDKNILDAPQRTLARHQIYDGCVVSVFIGGVGGGTKRSKETMLDEFQFSINPPDVLPDELDVVKKAFQLRVINVSNWVKFLNTDDSAGLLKVLEEQGKGTWMTRSRSTHTCLLLMSSRNWTLLVYVEGLFGETNFIWHPFQWNPFSPAPPVSETHFHQHPLWVKPIFTSIPLWVKPIFTSTPCQWNPFSPAPPVSETHFHQHLLSAKSVFTEAYSWGLPPQLLGFYRQGWQAWPFEVLQLGSWPYLGIGGKGWEQHTDRPLWGDTDEYSKVGK